MDVAKIDVHALARQLRKPEGDAGRQVGEVMAQYNAQAIAFAIKHLHVRSADHVLEIGFGPGEGIAELVRHTPNGYIAGIDHSQTMLETAEQRNHRAIMQEHVELTLGDARVLPYEDESFDKVFAVNVFHFWSDPSQELKECARVLKPGGRALFYLTHPSSWLKGLETTGVFVAREPEETQRILEQAGFRNVKSHVLESKDGKGCVVLGEK